MNPDDDQIVDGTADEDAPQVDAVVVLKHKTDDGSISTDIIIQGNVEPTEVQTLLELGINGWRQRIGLTR